MQLPLTTMHPVRILFDLMVCSNEGGNKTSLCVLSMMYAGKQGGICMARNPGAVTNVGLSYYDGDSNSDSHGVSVCKVQMTLQRECQVPFWPQRQTSSTFCMALVCAHPRLLQVHQSTCSSHSHSQNQVSDARIGTPSDHPSQDISESSSH